MRIPGIGRKRNEKAKLICPLANSYRKGIQQKHFNIKAQGSDMVLTERHAIEECWTYYCSSLLNVKQHQEEICPIYKHNGDFLRCENDRGSPI